MTFSNFTTAYLLRLCFFVRVRFIFRASCFEIIFRSENLHHYEKSETLNIGIHVCTAHVKYYFSPTKFIPKKQRTYLLQYLLYSFKYTLHILYSVFFCTVLWISLLKIRWIEIVLCYFVFCVKLCQLIELFLRFLTTKVKFKQYQRPWQIYFEDRGTRVCIFYYVFDCFRSAYSFFAHTKCP